MQNHDSFIQKLLFKLFKKKFTFAEYFSKKPTKQFCNVILMACSYIFLIIGQHILYHLISYQDQMEGLDLSEWLKIKMFNFSTNYSNNFLSYYFQLQQILNYQNDRYSRTSPQT